ncbi:DUF4124 domain-containing protein [Methylomonas paludis]|uniref:DUF4124 domain-containing protein n=1 Tax=Methylomonas paludis TaxID=1173101 RepID=A0A975MQ98_9GAMM|nr:DUF4124 domain-containing protein [Methylomonas paludis]QWF71997.1 DUF4124 domain-containing protein [Methylomonas paludis]
MSRLGSAPIGVYSDDGAVLQGLQGPNGNIFYLLAASTEVPVPLNAFWRTPIPAGATLASNSAALVTEFMRQFAVWGNVSVTTDTFTNTVFMADKSTPAVIVSQVGGSNAGLIQQFSNVPIPPYAVPSPDGLSSPDYGMTIYDPDSDTLWEFWKAQQVSGAWQAQWGGKLTGYSQSNGIFPYPYGASATGLPITAGHITAEELARGSINHAIGISLIDAEDSSIFSWPANRSDGHNPTSAPNRIMEGQRFRLDPSINVDALHLTRVGKMVAKAAQIYGFVVMDKGGALVIRAKNSMSYMAQGMDNPYPPLFGGLHSWAILQNFPWASLQFLPQNYGQPA